MVECRLYDGPGGPVSRNKVEERLLNMCMARLNGGPFRVLVRDLFAECWPVMFLLWMGIVPSELNGIEMH